MNKNDANTVLNQMRLVLEREFPNHNVKMGRTTFNNLGKINFKFSLIDKESAQKVKETDELIGMKKNGVHVDAIGVSFKHNGKTYIVESISTRKMKHCVTCRREDNKLFRFTANFINEKVFEATGSKFVRWY